MTPSSPASDTPSIADRIATVRRRIDAACRAAGRDPDQVVLTAVSKTQPSEAIVAALVAGQTVFGENRVQEAIRHWQACRPDRPELELRLIGPLQTNKAAAALALFDVIETVDRSRLVRALADGAMAAGESPRVLVQVNTGREPQKAGVDPDGVEALIREARDLGLTVEGLMCIPPVDQPPRPHFETLSRIAAQNGLAVLSMGMSADYETAIACGSTHVRVGSALFGERNRPQEPSRD